MYKFEEIVGNAHITKNLKSAIAHQRVSHAYIITGQSGSGKKLMANTFAKALQCENSTGCGVCGSCRTFDSGNNPDIFYVKPTKTKAIGADDIREQILKKIEIKQYKHKYKIFIIDNADKMSVTAQNAFLKTLEEPPSYGIFLLLAESIDLFLPTILSRCVVLKINPLGNETVRLFLEKEKGLSVENSIFFSEYAYGSIGKAIKLWEDETFKTMRDDVINKLSRVKETDLATLFLWAKELEKYKEYPEMIDIIYLWYRDLLMAKRLEDKKYILQKDKLEKIFDLGKEETLQGINRKLSAVALTKQRLRQNANFQLALEVMFLKLKES
ncbi:MAG: ATP-binding protein [Anaerotignaceae bacterium]